MKKRDEQRFLREAIEASPIAVERGIQIRPYQLDLADTALRVLGSGHNVGVTLPTGLGKTMVADLISRSWIDRHPNDTVVSIVPRRVLVDQHSRHARWLHPPVRVSGLDASDRRVLNRCLRDNELVITTPGRLANAIDNDRVDEQLRRSIRLVLIDEADGMFTASFTEDGIRAEPHQALRLLLSGLDEPRFVLLTATPPQVDDGNAPPMRVALADAIAREFKVKNWRSAKNRAIQRFIPGALVIWTFVDDPHVRKLDIAIDDEIMIIFDLIDDAAGRPVNRGYFRTRCAAIAAGSCKTYIAADGGRYPITGVVRDACRGLVKRYGDRLYLYEDDMYGYKRYESEYRRRPVWRLIGPDPPHRADLRGKYRELCAILDAHAEESGLVFVRYFEVAEEIHRRLLSAGRDTRILHGDLDDSERASVREWFRSSDNGILILTRSTGGRGLDIPEADFAVFYSPKREVDTVWQEMSRIRATAHNLKPSYVLVYAGSNESSKAKTLTAQMDREPHRFTQKLLNS